MSTEGLRIKRKYSPEQWHEHFQKQIDIPEPKETDETPEKTLDIPGKIKQSFIFLERDILSKISNRQYVLINLLEAPALALLLAFITKYAPSGSQYSFYANENIPVFFFMSIIVALFMGLTVSAEEIIKDRKILKREAFLHLQQDELLVIKNTAAFRAFCYSNFTFCDSRKFDSGDTRYDHMVLDHLVLCILFCQYSWTQHFGRFQFCHYCLHFNSPSNHPLS